MWRVGGAASCPGCHCLACILNKLPCCDPLCGAVLSSWQEYIDLRSVLICSSPIQSCTHNSARTWSSVLSVYLSSHNALHFAVLHCGRSCLVLNTTSPTMHCSWLWSVQISQDKTRSIVAAAVAVIGGEELSYSVQLVHSATRGQ